MTFQTQPGQDPPVDAPAVAQLQKVHPRVWATAVVAFLGAVLLLAAIWILARPIMLLLAGITIAQALAPLVARMERRMPRPVAVLIIYLILVIILIGIGLLVVPQLIDQGETLVEEVPDIFEDVEQQLVEWGIVQYGEILERLQSQAGSASELLVDVPMRVVTATLDTFLVLVVSIYWLIAMPAMWGFVLSLFREERRDDVAEIVTEMGTAMGGFVRGEGISSLVIGAISYVALVILDVRFALILAIVGGLLEIIPSIGPLLGGVLAAGVALLDSPTKALLVVAAWVAIQGFESYILIPNVMKRQAHIPPLLVILAVFTGGYVGGLLGALVAIPITGAARVFVVRVIAPAVRLWSGAEESKRVV